jgi:two-component system, cell cycle sensor histidine kinase and response regulator CckA
VTVPDDESGEDEEKRLAALASANSVLVARHRAEDLLLRTLRRNEERTNYALGAAHTGVWEFDLVTRELTWSETMAPLFGLKPGEVLASPDAVLARIHLDDRAVVEDCVAHAARDGTDLEVEFRVAWPDGDTHWLAARGRVLRDETDRPVRVLGIGTDISDRKSLEAQLHQAQKLEAVGLLAGGIAHDFNNILSVILSYSEFLLQQVGSTSPFRGDLEEIHKAGKRAADLTRQVLAFSRQQVLAPKILDLNDVLVIVSNMLTRVLGEDIELETLLAKDLGKVKADPGQIEQVIVNLVVNARDAMPRGGKVTIETSNVRLDDADAAVHVGVTPGRHVMIAVSDTGVGMDKITQSRIFEPFFTTKERGKGSGLGLSTVFGIVQQSGGTIWVYSEPNVGTTFKVYLPRAPDQASSPSVGSTRPPRSHGGETILLVEDDDQVRAVASSILKDAGYRVFQAGTPAEAFALCAEHGDEIDLLLTDVVMPKMSGRQLAEQIVALRANVKVLFMSGYTDDAIVRHGVLDSGVAFLQKPLTPSALTRRIREVLDTE